MKHDLSTLLKPLALLTFLPTLHCSSAADAPAPARDGLGPAGGDVGSAGAGIPSAAGGVPGGGGVPAVGAGGAGGASPGAGGTGATSPGAGGTGATGAGGAGFGGAGAAGSTGGTGGGQGGMTPTGFINLAPPMGEPLDLEAGTPLSPPAPAGWTWFEIDGAVCRDGSPAGFFVHEGTADKLLWYLEGGGACSSPGFCNYNPANVDMALSGDGQTVLGSALGAIPARQQPGVFEGGQLHGIFDLANPDNPYGDWSMIYTPYCTGDVYFGTKANGTIPGLAEPQQFVGHLNMEKFVGRIVPTFGDRVSRVVLTGASAGSFGAALNFSMVQDSFGDVPVDAILDSGVPFSDTYMPPCLQQYWRDTWGFADSLPPDCEQCFDDDGGGLLGMADFLMEKHPKARVAAISSMQDEVIRLFFSAGLNDCATVTTADPVMITVGQIAPGTYMDGMRYQSALEEVRSLYLDTGRLATYFIGGPNITFHQHTWRPRFYEPVAGGETIADFVRNFLDGEVEQVGP